jgi:lysophospholipase L1-like esterase
MLECLIIGDSIAFGVSMVRPECTAIVRSGINSANWNRNFLPAVQPAKTVIISLGTNDSHIDTESNLRKLRAAVKAPRVFWLLPSHKLRSEQFRIVNYVARMNGDIVIPRPEKDISPDGIHPTNKGYKTLGYLTK